MICYTVFHHLSHHTYCTVYKSRFQMIARLAIVLTFLAAAEATVKVRDQQFVDEKGRTLIFHGMNAVYKIAPWLPNVEGFDVDNSLSDIDAQNLKSWGFNVVRLGVMWPGVEPGNRGDYNMTYLQEIGKIVDNLGKSDIYVILDLHQDLLHRM
jgi:endoglycosylceramidase